MSTTDRCLYCSVQPTSGSDYCDKHRPIDGKKVDALIDRLQMDGKSIRLSEADRKLITKVLNQLRGN